MKFSILTIFPEMFDGFLRHGIVRRALDRHMIKARLINIRDHASGRHRVTDDRPFGGGDGMVMKPEPLAGAVREATMEGGKSTTIFLTPQGERFDQRVARDLAGLEHLVLLCGRYEGVDERICETMVDREISIGDYVLTGGEIPAMVIIDAITRLLPGALGGEQSAVTDSFADHILGHAQYTRPREFEGESVPDFLMSGNHDQIDLWRTRSALVRTCLKRPDLLNRKKLNAEEIDILIKWRAQIDKIIRKTEG